MRVFETPAFRMTIHDDLLKEFVVKDGVDLSGEDVKTSLKLSEEHMPGARFYVLVEAEGGGGISHEARRLAASRDYSNYTAALALCSSNLMMAIAGNLFLKINRPKVPTRFFDNRERALVWLKSFIAGTTAPGTP